MMLRRVVLLFALLFSLLPRVAAEEISFYALTRQNGLSSNTVLQMMQLADGRMAVVTDTSIDLFDGQQVSAIPIDTTRWMAVPAYGGATHLFADGHDRMWMKLWGRLFCFDLRTMSQQMIDNWQADYFFIDDAGETWTLKGRELQGSVASHLLTLPADAGRLQDVVRVGEAVYTFVDTGRLVAFKPEGTLLFQSTSYPSEQAEGYEWTSLVVKDATETNLYQVRTGPAGSVLQAFHIATREWRQLLSLSGQFMHTLTVTNTGMLYLTTPEGYLHINPATDEIITKSELRLPDGSVLTGEGINTVCLDREGGIWLGTYNSGLLYTSPLAGLFDTELLNIEVYPILTTIYLHGQPLQVGAEYDGRPLLSVAPPYADSLSFRHDENSLAFLFSTMNYVRPRSTCYRYRFSGDDSSDWHTLSADSLSRLVDDKGTFYLPLVGLSPGHYTVEVMATTNPARWDENSLRRISFTIEYPWWRSPLAYVVYTLLLILFISLFFLLYRRRLERKNRESMLLLRIQNLAEQVSQYEHSEAMVVLSEPQADEETAQEPEPSPQEKAFMAKATALVEQHLATPGYGVEQLAADLCMERTGLYKKLTALIEQPPVVFIRSIRLQRAAELLRQGAYSVNEVAELTGFSSVSYFRKCFQREFGCKPSEYTEQQKNE